MPPYVQYICYDGVRAFTEEVVGRSKYIFHSSLRGEALFFYQKTEWSEVRIFFGNSRKCDDSWSINARMASLSFH
jgi:hypothetical protein